MAQLKELDLSKLTEMGYQIDFHSHAKAIITHDFPDAWNELEQCLLQLRIPVEELIGSGGGEAKSTQRLRQSLAQLGWNKTKFSIDKTINGVPRESISHEVDHVREFKDVGVIALEIEWNNKDPFFDRDLENFKRLHAEGAISAGIIVTRGETLQSDMREIITYFVNQNNIENFDDLVQFGYTPTPKQKKAIELQINREKDPVSFCEAFVQKFVSNKYGAATTHWAKLIDRIHRGVGNPCPLVLFGLPSNIVKFDNN